ncbi:MAG TPA: hypothetical protein VJV78_24155 [Polyangiales bacterium]|nr:hypothetical protein [Polyangiales bacterium]
MDTYLRVWWAWLTWVALFNVVLWFTAARWLRRRESTLPRSRRVQHALAGAYVFVTAFRSVLPRADVQRMCLVDSYLSSVLVGRTVATVAELCFAIQWAMFVRELADHTRVGSARAISRVLVPLIVWAEVSSWYAVLTTNFLGNAIEQSTWTLSGTLIAVAYLRVWPYVDNVELRRFLRNTALVIACFVTFMCTVDVPLYLSRWRADELAGRAYLPWTDGFVDAAQRWVVVHEWEPWRPEAAWMALYFSVGVWVSIAFSMAPARAAEPNMARTPATPPASRA